MKTIEPFSHSAIEQLSLQAEIAGKALAVLSSIQDVLLCHNAATTEAQAQYHRKQIWDSICGFLCWREQLLEPYTPPPPTDYTDYQNSLLANSLCAPPNSIN